MYFINNPSRPTGDDGDGPVSGGEGEEETAGSGRVPAGLAPVYPSHTLFRGGREVFIEHGGHRYRLRITRQDKLILTK